MNTTRRYRGWTITIIQTETPTGVETPDNTGVYEYSIECRKGKNKRHSARFLMSHEAAIWYAEEEIDSAIRTRSHSRNHVVNRKFLKWCKGENRGKSY